MVDWVEEGGKNFMMHSLEPAAIQLMLKFLQESTKWSGIFSLLFSSTYIHILLPWMFCHLGYMYYQKEIVVSYSIIWLQAQSKIFPAIWYSIHGWGVLSAKWTLYSEMKSIIIIAEVGPVIMSYSYFPRKLTQLKHAE